jgi:hypothetical protein
VPPTAATSKLSHLTQSRAIGGLLLSQILTLFTTPVVYIYFARFAAWVRPKHEEARHRAPTVFPAVCAFLGATSSKADGGADDRIMVLMGLALDDPESMRRVAAFAQALQEFGWTDGRNVRFDYRRA